MKINLVEALKSGKYSGTNQWEGLAPYLYNYPEQIAEVRALVDSVVESEARGAMTILRELYRILPDLAAPLVPELLLQIESPFPGVRLEALRLLSLSATKADFVQLANLARQLERLWAIEPAPSVRQEIIVAAGKLAEREEFAVQLLVPMLFGFLHGCRETEKKALARTLRRLGRKYPEMEMPDLEMGEEEPAAEEEPADSLMPA